MRVGFDSSLCDATEAVLSSLARTVHVFQILYRFLLKLSRYQDEDI